MMTYKQWHDNDLTFNNEMMIYFCQCDIHSNLILSELLRITTDTAVEDYNQRGLSYDFLRDLFMDNLPHDAKLFNEYHALFVRLAKELCRKNICLDDCPLR